jgi:hypothetical protein
MSSLTKRPLNETRTKYSPSWLKAHAGVSSTHLNKHRLINSLAAHIDETCPRRVDTPAVLPPKIFPVLPGSLYHQRWRVETSLAQLKTSMQMDVLHCKTVPGVLKELTVFAIVDYLIRMVMCQSATLQHIGVERISFLDALRWLSAPSTGRPLVALIVNTIRPHRVEPRVKKRRPKSFPLTIKPRQELRQQLLQQELRG